MILETAEVALCTEVLSAHTWFEVIEPIREEPVNGNHWGKIEVPTIKERLTFGLMISEDFPLDSMYFICPQVLGYPHVSPNGLLCLHAAPAEGIEGRLELELDKLQLWIEKYYIKEEKDERFEYLQFPAGQEATTMVFEEDEKSPPINENRGLFFYHLLNDEIQNDRIIKNFIITAIGGREGRWSQAYKSTLTEKFTGIWLTIPSLPVAYRRLRIEKWENLLTFLDNKQKQFLYERFRDLRSISGFSDRIMIMLGYQIPDGTKQQWHWDSISIRSADFPFKKKKLGPDQFEFQDFGKKIQWACSENASYSRMFGRGKLSDALTNSKILIIGAGAIGSNLLVTLTRGGCKQINLIDGDIIGSGNGCRGNFGINDTGKFKTHHLRQTALNISPYLEIIESSIKLLGLSQNSKSYSNIRKLLSDWDYIMDCSTDKYLSIMFDKMQLKGQILNFSISNGANHLVMATGFNNTTILKNNIYNRIAPGINEPFFEGTGCWHPTFQASFSDLNVLVANAVNEINHRILSSQPISSFIIHKTVTENNKIRYETDYYV
jgi:hypothetical protein